MKKYTAMLAIKKCREFYYDITNNFKTLPGEKQTVLGLLWESQCTSITAGSMYRNILPTGFSDT